LTSKLSVVKGCKPNNTATTKHVPVRLLSYTLYICQMIRVMLASDEFEQCVRAWRKWRQLLVDRWSGVKCIPSKNSVTFYRDLRLTHFKSSGISLTP